MTRTLGPVLVLMCRRPALGKGKQRLARVLGATETLAIAQALLECALEDAAAWTGQLIIAPEDPADISWAQGLLDPPAAVLPQSPGNLGVRLNAVDFAARACGADRVIFIGSDAPSLTVSELLAAASALDRSDVVLVPATDGGVTLMGSRVAWPDLAALPWGESILGAALLSCCRDRGLCVAQLPSSYDVDEVPDLETARVALAADERPARRRLYQLLLRMAAAPAPDCPTAAGCEPRP